MRKTASVLLLAAIAILAAAGPAEAQEKGAMAYPAGEEPLPPPPDYAYRGGMVRVSGDEEVGCREFVEGFDEGYDEYGDQR